MLLALSLAALLGEGTLRLAGYGHPGAFFIKSAERDVRITNAKFACRFFGNDTVLQPVFTTLALPKPAGVVRICVLGESAAMGTPDPAFGFSRILELDLRKRYPGRQFEIINAAMRGINSHIIREIARESAAGQVDAFVLYMGNNEVLGFHAPSPRTPAFALSPRLLRAGDWLRSTRLGQLFASLLLRSRGTGPAPDMDHFRSYRLDADDWRRAKVLENFAANLDAICGAATRAGAPVVLSTVPVNLADCPPLGSLHRPDLADADRDRWAELYAAAIELEKQGNKQPALEKYLAASKLDSHYAELHYRIARCALALGDIALAQTHYTLACDRDALQFRADSRLNQALAEAASRWRDRRVTLADTRQAFAASGLARHGLPGEALFHDHVHPTFSGNWLLASNVCVALSTALKPALGEPAAGELPGPKDAADALAYTLYSELNVASSMVRLTSAPPFLDQLDHDTRQAASNAEIRRRLAAFSTDDAAACLHVCYAALEKRPGDWMLHQNLALFCLELGRLPEAVRHARAVVDQNPECARFRLDLAAALFKSGDRPGALAQLQEGLRRDPHDLPLRSALQRMSGSK